MGRRIAVHHDSVLLLSKEIAVINNTEGIAMEKRTLRDKIIQFAADQYGTQPEHLWSKYPNYVVLRNNNNKWYAIIMDFLDISYELTTHTKHIKNSQK